MLYWSTAAERKRCGSMSMPCNVADILIRWIMCYEVWWYVKNKINVKKKKKKCRWEKREKSKRMQRAHDSVLSEPRNPPRLRPFFTSGFSRTHELTVLNQIPPLPISIYHHALLVLLQNGCTDADAGTLKGAQLVNPLELLQCFFMVFYCYVGKLI